VTARSRYAEVLSAPGALPALLASWVGRVSLGTTGLAMLLTVEGSTGSYADAGVVAAGYALAFALAAPGRARSADRDGPRRVLVQCGLLHPVALVVLAVLAERRSALGWLLLAAVAAGVTVPPHGAVMRALWAVLVRGPALATAYALEAVVVELCFVVGPLVVAVVTAVASPTAALLVSAALGSGGALWLAAVGAVRSVEPHEERPTSWAGPLVSPAVRSLLLTVLWIGLGFGAVEVAVPAFVEEQGSRPGAAGLLLAVWALGSMLGGLLYGAVHPQSRPARQLPVLVAALAVGCLLPVLAPGTVLLGAALLAYGSTIAPFSACNSVLLGGHAPTGTATEAFAWNGSMIFGGAAAGNALAGFAVEHSGAAAALAVTAVGGVLALASSLWGLRVLRAA
jgi:predicted MFS family arabinose efflux permease